MTNRGRTDIGQYLFASDESLALKMGFTQAFFKLSGTLPVKNKKLFKYVNGGEKMSLTFFKNIFDIFSMPWFVFFKLAMITLYSPLLTSLTNEE